MSDLRRTARVYGTSKPSVGIISHFYGKHRVPDERLRSYLPHLTPAPRRAPTSTRRNLIITDLMPGYFPQLLQRDAVLNDLWHGKGQPSGTDESNSGYDYTIACHLAHYHNITSHDEMATIIALRPTGAQERARKGVEYLLRTVTIALARQNAKHPSP